LPRVDGRRAESVVHAGWLRERPLRFLKVTALCSRLALAKTQTPAQARPTCGWPRSSRHLQESAGNLYQYGEVMQWGHTSRQNSECSQRLLRSPSIEQIPSESRTCSLTGAIPHGCGCIRQPWRSREAEQARRGIGQRCRKNTPDREMTRLVSRGSSSAGRRGKAE